MALFHDEDDGPDEPVLGLPQHLPEGERIVWQGRASGKTLAIHAFHVRSVAIYFMVIVATRIAFGLFQGQSSADFVRIAGMTTILGVGAVMILSLLAWSMARRSCFTVTNKRIVVRHGVAIRKYINIPFGDVKAVNLRQHPSGDGDIALETIAGKRIPYFHLWPFARPLRLTNTVPLIRAIPDAAGVANALAHAMKAAAPEKASIHQLATPAKGQQAVGLAANLEPEASLS